MTQAIHVENNAMNRTLNVPQNTPTSNVVQSPNKTRVFVSKRKYGTTNGSPEDASAKRQPSKIHKAGLSLNRPLTYTVEKEYQKAMKELGRNRHGHKPNLIERKKSDITDASDNSEDMGMVGDEQTSIIPRQEEDSILQETINSQVFNNTDWKTVTSAKHKGKPTHSTQIELQNKFNVLTSSTDGATDPTKENKTPIGTNKQAKIKSSKPPPIYCHAESTKGIINLLAIKLEKNSFHVKEVTDKEQSIHAKDADTYDKIKNYLKEKEIPFFSYTPKANKNKLLVLKGINKEYTEDEVLNDLNNLQLPNVNIVKVNKIHYTNARSESASHFLVQLSSDSNASGIVKQRKLLCQAVKWEQYRKHKVFQCFNCQRVGHSSSNCNLGYRCIKCKEKHKPGECNRAKETNDRETLYCVNCNSTGHAANYRGCSYLQFAQTAVNANKALQKQTSINKSTTDNVIPNPGSLYSTVLKDQSNTPSLRFQRSNQVHVTQRTNTNQDNDVLSAGLLKSVLSEFKQDIITTISAQNTSIQNQLNNHNDKIEFILNKLNLKWQ